MPSWLDKWVVIIGLASLVLVVLGAVRLSRLLFRSVEMIKPTDFNRGGDTMLTKQDGAFPSVV